MATERIALSMIVKDASETIGRCLASLRPYVDRVFIFDTGSTDGTVELLRRLDKDRGTSDKPLAPIVVEEGEWRDDFAWARERSFAMPDDSFDWLLWADADDVVVGADCFRWVVKACPPEIQACVCDYEYRPPEPDERRLRLVRRSAGLRWRGAVHETLVAPDGEPVRAEALSPELVRFIHRAEPAADHERNLGRLLALKKKADAKGEKLQPRMISHLALAFLDVDRFDDAADVLGPYLDDPKDAFEHLVIAQSLNGLAITDGEGLLYLCEVLGAADEDGFEWGAVSKPF